MKCQKSGYQIPVTDSRVKTAGLGKIIKCTCGKNIKVRLVGFGNNYYGPKGYLIPTHTNKF